MSVKHLLFANSIFYRPRHEKYHNYVITVSILLNLLQLCYRRIVTFLINIVNCFLGRAVARFALCKLFSAKSLTAATKAAAAL